jgi:hypothetical protein
MTGQQQNNQKSKTKNQKKINLGLLAMETKRRQKDQVEG